MLMRFSCCQAASQPSAREGPLCPATKIMRPWEDVHHASRGRLGKAYICPKGYPPGFAFCVLGVFALAPTKSLSADRYT